MTITNCTFKLLKVDYYYNLNIVTNYIIKAEIKIQIYIHHDILAK